MEDQMMDSKVKMMDKKDKMMMSGGGGCMSKSCKDIRSVVNGYEEFTLDGKNYRVYGSMNGMTPREYVESWGQPLTNAYFRKSSASSSKKRSSSKKASPKRPKWSLPEHPTRRQPSRKSKTATMRGMTKGSKRKNNKTKKQRKH